MYDNRSKKFIFVPFCLMAQAYQAQGIVKYEHKASIKPIMQLLIEKDINIIQMPCPESLSVEGLIRSPKGISKYDTKDFNNLCEELATNVFKNIKQLIVAKYEIIAILGIEQSPSCCVNYIYTNKGMENRKGLFIDKLANMLEINNINIPIIGINRKYIQKSLVKLNKLIENIES